MGKFEDEIRKKLAEGEFNFNPDHWNQIENKLSESPSPTPFEDKIKDTFSNAEVTIPLGSWDNFSKNVNSLDQFEKELKNKINNSEVTSSQPNWSEFSKKLSESNLSKFERGIKFTLEKGKIEFNPKHWSQFEKILNANRRKKIIWRAAAAILLLLGSGIGILSIDKKDSGLVKETNTPKSNISLENKNDSSLSKFENGNQSDEQIEESNHSSNELIGIEFSTNKIANSKKEENFKTTDFKKKKENLNNVSFEESTTPELNKITLAFNKIELCSPIELITKQINDKKSNAIERTIHPAASLWLNFWENAAVTGLYDKNNISLNYYNDWEFVDKNWDKQGELNFVQPLIYSGGYERRINKNWSLGGYYTYQLKKNWNNRETSIYASYSKKFFKDFDFRFGLGSSFKSQNLAVSKLTLREKASFDDYIFTTELGNLKSKTEYSSYQHTGAFLNHPYFFVGYSAMNIATQNYSNKNNIALLKQTFIGGIHSPEFINIKASGLFKYEKELFNYYTPSIGITYNERLFATFEYEKLSSKKLSIGYEHNKKIRAFFSINSKDLTDLQKNQLNLDNFTERQGHIAATVNYRF